jgi:hypothetical protein
MGFPVRPSRPWLARVAVLLVVVVLLAPSAVSALTYEPTELQRGTISEPADGLTVISVQGFHFQGEADKKKPARLVGVGPRGQVEWVHNGSKIGAVWFYDVDPLENGNLLVTATRPGETLVYEFDPETQEQVWIEEFDLTDTHDVDLVNGDELLIADKELSRLLVYNRTQGEVVWRWRFDDHYDRSDGGPDDDWTHFNDVDKIGDGRYLLSPRNFDQAIVVNRSTGDIEMQLGADDDHDTLYEQHNPDYLESEDGNPTVLVGDSENDRVVEYEKRGDDWERTWTVGEGQFTWPRDADRLPNGNTLIVDSMNHRVVEVTPRGDIVWEFYSPWAPYDVERVEVGDSSHGPTMADRGTTGSYDISGSAGLTPGTDGSATFSTVIGNAFAGTPFEEQARGFAARWDRVTPWIKPVWMTGWDFVFALTAALVFVGWLVVELVYQRHRIRRRVGGLVG